MPSSSSLATDGATIQAVSASQLALNLINHASSLAPELKLQIARSLLLSERIIKVGTITIEVPVPAPPGPVTRSRAIIQTIARTQSVQVFGAEVVSKAKDITALLISKTFSDQVWKNYPLSFGNVLHQPIAFNGKVDAILFSSENDLRTFLNPISWVGLSDVADYGIEVIVLDLSEKFMPCAIYVMDAIRRFVTLKKLILINGGYGHEFWDLAFIRALTRHYNERAEFWKAQPSTNGLPLPYTMPELFYLTKEEMVKEIQG